jgi:hypothetical protein
MWNTTKACIDSDEIVDKDSPVWNSYLPRIYDIYIFTAKYLGFYMTLYYNVYLKYTNISTMQRFNTNVGTNLFQMWSSFECLKGEYSLPSDYIEYPEKQNMQI